MHLSPWCDRDPSNLQVAQNVNNSMQYGFSGEVDGLSTSQPIFQILWHPRFMTVFIGAQIR